MVPKSRVIIDTDPGVDDILALLLALSASPEDIEVLLISVTYGNVEVERCLLNVVSMFHVIESELRWRRENGRSEGFETLRRQKPLVAVGADGPCTSQMMIADYFHGRDGLGGVHTSHPHHTSPEETWQTLFERPPPDSLPTSSAIEATHTSPVSSDSPFRASNQPSYLEILRILEESPPNTIDIIAIGPLTNLALAASHSPHTFLRAKSVLVMGGAVSVPGNYTPVGEFNIIADPVSAARVFALTSPTPNSTMPPEPPISSRKDSEEKSMPPYPPKDELGDKRLNLILFPLDITIPHELRRDIFEAKIKPLMDKGSPLAEWTDAIVGSTLRNTENLHHGQAGDSACISLHDPMCVWYALTAVSQQEKWLVTKGEDIRIETAGQWTRGMCVIDRRDRKMRKNDDNEGSEIPGDSGGWLAVPYIKNRPYSLFNKALSHWQTETTSAASYNSTKRPTKSGTPSEATTIQNHLHLLNPLKSSNMPCSTATSWMVPDDEYYTKTEDYALVAESARLIRSEIYQTNNYVAEPPSRPLSYGELLHLQRHEPAYEFACPSNHMIYANVDDSNPSHEQDIKELRSKEKKLEDTGEHSEAKTADAEQAFCTYLGEAWKGRYPPHTAEDAPFLEEAWKRRAAQADKDERMPPDALQAMFREWKMGDAYERFLEMVAHGVTPDSTVLNYIFGAGHEHREQLMYMISDQRLWPTKRPVMLLVDIFDSRQNSTPGIKTGWAIAYSILNQNIIIKPFYSDKDHHPLTSSWSHPVAEDGVSCVSTPLEFIKAYHHLANNVPTTTRPDHMESGGELSLKEPLLALRMLVHSLAAKWVLHHWPGLIGHWCETPEEATALHNSTKDAYEKIRSYLGQVPYPLVAKTTPSEAEKKIVVGPFAELEWTLEEMEDCFRAGAVAAREIGEEKIAGNVAVLYEKVMEMVKAFNENPRGEFSAWEIVQRDEVDEVEEKLGDAKLS